jgi:hypothetical protein
MFSPKSVSLLLSLIVFLAACSPEPKVLNRYADVSTKEATPDDLTPLVSFFALPVPQDKTQRTIFDLTGPGQAALLNGVARVTETPEELRSAASANLEVAHAQPADIDLTTFKRRVVFTVERGSRRPADRIEWFKIKLAIESPDYAFASWNKATTAYETIDLGTLKISQNRAAKISTSLNPADIGLLKSVGADFSGSESLDESQDQRRRIVDLNVSLPDDAHAAIVRQGAVDRDLDGNTVVDFDIAYTKANGKRAITKFSNLLKSDGEPIKADAIKMDWYEAYYPEKAEDIWATVNMEYYLRQVVDGHKTINESDDEVVVIHGEAKGQRRVIVSKADQELTVWRFTGGGGFVSLESGGSLSCKEPLKNSKLEFITEDEALDFYWWLYLYKTRVKSDEPIVITRGRLSLCLESGGSIKRLKWGDVQGLTANPINLNGAAG